jgi:hypothetical protein
MPHRTAIALALGALFSATTASAQGEPVVGYSIGTSLQQSDNINLSSTDPVSQTVLAPRLDFTVDEQGSTLSANAAGTLQYFDYLGGAFGNELRTLFSGNADWHISPDRLDWYLEDNISRQPIDAFDSNAPSNQQQTNVFSTGPTLRAKFTDVLRGRVDMRYTNSYSDTTTDFNSNRLGALGSLLYQLDPTDTLSGTVATSRTRYIESQSKQFDYDRYDAYLGYQRNVSQFSVEGAVGYSWLDLRSADSRSGSLLRGSLLWNPSAATSLGVTLSHQYSDAALDLVFTPAQLSNTGVGSGINGAVIAPQVYVENRVGFDINYQQETFRLGFAPFWRKLDYIQDPTDNQRSPGYYANAQYNLQPTLWFGFYAGQERRRYTAITRTDDDLAYGISLNLQRTRHWLWSVLVERQRRDSSAIDSSYSENSIILTITYRR